MDELIAGYRRFRTGTWAHQRARFEELSRSGQRPRTMLIACSDSRADPQMIFDARPGELFVVRNVANLVPPYETQGKYHGVSAALEFAALNLRVKHIVVLGHSGCGGVKACLDHEAARQTSAEFITNWMSMLDPARDTLIEKHGGHSSHALLPELEREGVKTSLTNLRTFPCVQILEGKGRLQLHGAHFDIATGTLEVLDRESGEFVKI